MRMLKTAAAGVALSLALVTWSGCNNKTTTPSTTADVTIQIVSRNGSSSYSPNPATVTVGQKVAWHNADSMTHTATANSSQFDTGAIAGGKTSGIVTMSTAGSFAYHCTFHPDMTGTVNVTP